jgi:hypothetical protein
MNRWDEMSEDEREVALFPIGYRMQLILTAYTKAALATAQIGAKAQLSMLEDLARLVGEFFTARAMKEIGPASETSVEMIDEALRADGDEQLSRSFKILTSRDVFAELLRLNPSWMRAIKLCGYGGAGAA